MIFKKSAIALWSASNASQMCPTGPEKLPEAALVEPKGSPRVPQSGSKSSLLPFWSIPNASESHMLDQNASKSFPTAFQERFCNDFLAVLDDSWQIFYESERSFLSHLAGQMLDAICSAFHQISLCNGISVRRNGWSIIYYILYDIYCIFYIIYLILHIIYYLL